MPRTNLQVSSGQAMSPLQRDILRTILYFDVFDHPVNAGEIYRFLPSNSTTVPKVLAECQGNPLKSILRNENGFYSLRSNPHASVADRSKKERKAKTLLTIASVVAKVLLYVPFVRAVGVTGELSKGVASASADIDFFIITAERRLWICRTLLVFLKKTLLLNSKRYFCINHIVSEERLKFDVQNLYTAMEIATLRAMRNPGLIEEYKKSNTWIEYYLPNVRKHDDSDVGFAQPFFQATVEKLLPQGFMDRLDERLMRFWKEIWQRRYSHLPYQKRNELFQANAFISTAYGQDHLSEVLDSYEGRLLKYNLQAL